MLWREGYAPRYAEGVTAPELVGTALDGSAARWTGPAVGLFGPRALVTVGVWTRLFQSEERTFRIILMGIDAKEARALFARSELGGVVIPSEPAVWSEFVPPEGAGTTFALTSCGASGAMLLVGPPTEDAWEAFTARLEGA